MKAFIQHVIAFSGLKPGTHRMTLHLDDAFFERFTEGEIRQGSLTVEVELVKEERMLVFRFDIRGAVTLPCDRCGDPVEIPVAGTERLIVRLGSGGEESEKGSAGGDDTIEWIPESDTRYDTAPFLYESVHLLLPMRRLHADAPDGTTTCNPEILAKLAELSPATEPDPRWETLKKLNT